MENRIKNDYEDIVDSALKMMRRTDADSSSYKFYEWRENDGFVVEIQIRRVVKLDVKDETDNG